MNTRKTAKTAKVAKTANRLPPRRLRLVTSGRRLFHVLPLLPTLAAFALPAAAAAPDVTPGSLSLTVEIAPGAGSTGSRQVVTFDSAARKQAPWFDVQDGREHNLRGVSLANLIARVKPPRMVDTVVFSYTDGMEIPVRLRDRDQVASIFVALEHGNVRDQFDTTYKLHDGREFPCPKIVYGRAVKAYSIWIYPTQLAAIRLVNWKAYEAALAQPTRSLPDRSGWSIYMRHCQSCHGIGPQGAKRGPNFLSDMDAYRRIAPLAVTDLSQHPSLHEKVKGYTEGQMPVLNHVSNQDIATLWRWLHAIHAGATK